MFKTSFTSLILLTGIQPRIVSEMLGHSGVAFTLDVYNYVVGGWPKAMMKYQIMSIPMQMFFNNGQKVDEILGAVPEHVIRTKVEHILNRFPN